jgi:hypothetical protein
MSHQVTWNVSDGWGVQCEARSVTPVLAEVAEGDHVGRTRRGRGVRPAGGRLKSARHLHQSRGGNSDASRHMGTRSSSLRNDAGDPDRLSHHVRTTGKTTTATPDLQPVSAWHSPGRFGIGDRTGSARSERHLRGSSRRVEGITTSEADGSASNTSGHRITGRTNTRQADEFRREHIPLQE